MATVQTQKIREERWREKYKDDGSSTRMNRLEITEMDHMRFKTA
jgi:phage portal protein BeeE